MDTLEQYIAKHNPKIISEYHRATTPFYYEPDVIYHPISNGMGCGSEGSNERLIIKNGTYCKGGDIQLTLQSLDKPENRYGCSLSEAHLKIARVDETVQPIGKHIPNNREVKYMTINGRDYRITQLRWRRYDTKELAGKIWVTCEQDTPVRAYGRDYYPYHELYSNFGHTWNYKHITSYDTTAREIYNIKMGVSMRYFKEKVFGDANIKIKCQLFGDK